MKNAEYLKVNFLPYDQKNLGRRNGTLTEKAIRISIPCQFSANWRFSKVFLFGSGLASLGFNMALRIGEESNGSYF